MFIFLFEFVCTSALNFVPEFPLLSLGLSAGTEHQGGEQQHGGQAGGGDGQGGRQDGDIQLWRGQREILQSLPTIGQATTNL